MDFENKIIYFDNAATTKPCEPAINAFVKSAQKGYANASSLHSFGVISEQEVEKAKKIILEGFAEQGEFVFTSGATESNLLAILGASGANKRAQRIVSTQIEHPSVEQPLAQLEKNGYEIIRISPGENMEQKLIDASDNNTLMLSLIAVNNETGFVIDTKRVYDGVKEKHPSCVIHTDAVQAFLKMKVYGDLISVSGHKLHSPKGIGGLFIKKGVRLLPVMCGGGQQGGLRGGTIPSELIASFGTAVEHYKYDLNHFNDLKTHFLQLLKSFGGVNINSVNNVPNIINFSIRGVRSEILLHFLAERNIFVSSGSACARGKQSSVLAAFGLGGGISDSAIRVSFCMDNTIFEIDEFFTVLEDILKRLKRKRK